MGKKAERMDWAAMELIMKEPGNAGISDAMWRSPSFVQPEKLLAFYLSRDLNTFHRV